MLGPISTTVSQEVLQQLVLPDPLMELLDSVKGKKVVVAMSGGVDSSVCALLLKIAGARVHGITMRTYKTSKCCSTEDVMDAIQIASCLGIPHTVRCVRELFEKTVVGYFLKETVHGRTPNPCVPCNIKIKFGELMKFAMEKTRADYYATGHYVRKKENNGRYMLLRAIDKKKDQSYVLSMLGQDVLEKALFPMGYLKKEQVRTIAERFGLSVYGKHDSQDLCFITCSREEFIRSRIPNSLKRWNVVDVEGNVLASYEMVPWFSIGQRRGLCINRNRKHYVKNIDVDNNMLVVCNKDDLYSNRFVVVDANLMTDMKFPIDIEVVVRNKMEPTPAVIDWDEPGRLIVSCKEPVWAVAPGQLAVFYKGDVVIGGGWIL